MSAVDWAVLIGTLLFIVSYGVWKTRGAKDLEGYLKGGSTAKWWGIGISVMATQASAITFLSTPGQAYDDGMRFVQFYLGLPIAMVILCVTFLPIYYRLKVYTAYEFLESRFDLKTRTLAAVLFLVQRGLAAGITIYAPSIILSTLLGWDLALTNILIGVLVIIYTMSGGTKAVTQTQKQQMAVMMGGMILAGIMVIRMLPDGIGLGEAMHVAGKMDKLNAVDFSFDLNNRYNIWSGLTAAVFLFMSYFGTDQSQVQRYLSGRSLAESRLGLIMNGLLKVPMQFVILFIGVMVFVLFQFDKPPVFFNSVVAQEVVEGPRGSEYEEIEAQFHLLHDQKRESLYAMVEAVDADDEAAVRRHQADAQRMEAESKELRVQVRGLIEEIDPSYETNDKDYVFMSFVMGYLPMGMIGLLFAVMFSAAMSSTASELNALASTTTIDIYKRSIRRDKDERHYLLSSRLFTLMWGLFAIGFATLVNMFDNLIQAVNILGSLFYGTILGVFLVAFYCKSIRSNAVFLAAVLAEVGVLTIHFGKDQSWMPHFLQMEYLWYNVAGCLFVVVLGYLFQATLFRSGRESDPPNADA